MRLRFAGHIDSIDAATVEQIEFGVRTVATVAEGKATTAFLRERFTHGEGRKLFPMFVSDA